jgi:23S rRNA pseudouridine2605 synthase
MSVERLQKILANAGVASRRKAEELIVGGRVSVNGKTVTELGSKADLAVDEVKVDGQRLKAPLHHVYFAFHKPKNVITTVTDPEGRQTVMSFFKGLRERIYPVGRLDYASEGLLLLTNDGEFANKISSPSQHIPKTYLVKVTGTLSSEQEEEFRRGIPMHGRRTAPARLRKIREGENPWYEVTISEGRQNQIRIMFKHLGVLVEKLKRTKIGFLELGALKPGAYRTLTRYEVEGFHRQISTDQPAASKPARHRGPKNAPAAPPRKFAAGPGDAHDRKADAGGRRDKPQGPSAKPSFTRPYKTDRQETPKRKKHGAVRRSPSKNPKKRA